MKNDLRSVRKNSNGTNEYKGSQWLIRTYHTPCFTIQVSRYMEIFADVFQKAFTFRTTSDLQPFVPVMTVYPDEASFLKAIGKESGFRGLFHYRIESIPGRIQSADLLLSTFYETDASEPEFNSQAPLTVLQHEATHCLLKKMFGTTRIPKWLNEGIACYFESWDLRQELPKDENSAAIVRARDIRRTRSWRVPQLQYHFSQNPQEELPRLSFLTSLNTAKTWDIDNMGPQTIIHYCLAESFVDYLMNSREKRPFLYTMLQRLHDKKPPTISPAEQREHEKAWLMFLEEKWGMKFAPDKIAQRVGERKEPAGQPASGNTVGN